MREKNIQEYYNETDIVKGYGQEYDPSSLYARIVTSLIPGKRILSLGCGGGREVRLLVRSKGKVTAVDFAEEMIKQSKKIEPRAKYYCMDAVEFVKKNRKKTKFDYILGLFTFLCYIKKKDRKEFVKGLMEMLDKDGEAIFTVHYISNTWKDFIKFLIGPIMALYLKEEYEFGDAYFNLSTGVYTIAHHFTKRQIRKLFRDYDCKIRRNEIRVRHKK